MHEETRISLRSVMRDQAYGHALFSTASETAKNIGERTVADLFERAAETRLEEHFTRLARLVDPSPGIADLLADAIRLDLEQDYRQFIVRANDVGDTEVAETLASIHSVRDAELETLQAAGMRHQLTASPPPSVTTDKRLEAPPTTAKPKETESEGPSRPEPIGAPRTADEYRVLHIDKQTRKTEQGARDLEASLIILAGQGWNLTATVGSQLIMHRRLA